MSAAEIRLHIDQVRKSYGRRLVLDAISAELSVGDSLIVTGPNGSGKSTLLRLLAGLQRPSSGAVHYICGGIAYAPAQARQWLGLVGADVQLYRELTAIEHLSLVARLRGLQDSPHLWAAQLAEVGLAGHAHERIGAFSSGMLQRMRYLLALLHRPPVLLLDEPTTNLDAAGIALADEIAARQRRQGILVVATNDRRDFRYGDLILTLSTEY